MGFGCSYHPFECSHDRFCEHCTLAKTKWHNPNKCALCLDIKGDDGKPIRLVKEAFAIRVPILDLSSRKQKVKFNNAQPLVFVLPKINRQQELGI